MKTHGICNAQSARKHRRQGHVVAPSELHHKLFVWGITAQDIPTIDLKLSGQRVELAIIDDVPPCVPVARLVKHAEWIGERGTHHRISVGESYWPKRRNQHSKPYRILRIMSSGSAQILYDRGDDTGRAETSLVLFRELIGKRCD